MELPKQKSFDFANEITKQIITLCTGILALSITFLKNFTEKGVGIDSLLLSSWIFLLIAIIFGILTLSALTAQLHPKNGSPDPSIWAAPVVAASCAQYVSFIVALGLLIWFGFSFNR